MRTRPFALLASLSAVALAAACGGGAAEDDDTSSSGTGAATTSSAGGGDATGPGGSGPGVGGSGATGPGPSSSSSADGASSSSATTGGSGGCMPDCSSTECGPDPVCGENCGTCTGQDTCINGSCVCQPDCTNKECGDDGCGGECGPCTSGTCSNNICVECQPNQTLCNGNDVLNIQVCNANFKWQTQACPQYSVCVQGGCEPVCDGYLATQTLPSACFFPLSENGNNGLFYMVNDSNKLTPATRVDGFFHDGVNNTPIYSTTGTAWPWAWSLIGSSEVGIAQFKLTGFSPPIQRSRFYFRGRRTGFVQTSYPSRYSFGASSGSIFASGTLYANYAWTNHYFEVTGTYAQQYSPTNWNFNMVSSVGDGFGHLPDEVEISWFMLEILD